MQPLFQGILLCARRGMMTWCRLMTGGCDASALPLGVETQRAAGRLRSSCCPLNHKRPVVLGSHAPAGGIEHRNFPTVDVCFTLLVLRWQVDGRRQDAVEAAAGVSAASGEQQPARQPGRRLQRTTRPRWVRMRLLIHELSSDCSAVSRLVIFHVDSVLMMLQMLLLNRHWSSSVLDWVQTRFCFLFCLFYFLQLSNQVLTVQRLTGMHVVWIFQVWSFVFGSFCVSLWLFCISELYRVSFHLAVVVVLHVL